MSGRHSQCPTCGYYYSDEDAFYSEDCARYYSMKPLFVLTWCYHCAHVAVHERPFLARLLRAQAVRYTESASPSGMGEHRLFRKDDPRLGAFAGAHLMRMVWHCLTARAALEAPEADHGEVAMHLALRKLVPRDVALMAAVTSTAPMMVPLEQQLLEGAYLGEPVLLGSLKAWIASAPNQTEAQAALSALDGYRLS